MYDYDSDELELDAHEWVLERIEELSPEEAWEKIGITSEEAAQYGKKGVWAILYAKLETEFERDYSHIVADKKYWEKYESQRDELYL